VILTGCGFRPIERGALPGYESISVPYVEGDHDGSFTQELVRQVSRVGFLRYQRENGQLSLKVRVVERSHKNIGYRFDQNPSGSFNNRLLPSEGRLDALVEITLVDSQSGKVLMGPAIVRAFADFDHDFYTTAKRSFRLSLGQVDDQVVALEQASKPLNQALAKRVVDLIEGSW
jgi:hypothetical protein